MHDNICFRVFERIFLDEPSSPKHRRKVCVSPLECYRKGTLSVTTAIARKQIVNGHCVVIELPRGAQYRVDLKRGTCSCPAGSFRGKCKHVAFARRLVDLLRSSVPEAAGMMKAG